MKPDFLDIHTWSVFSAEQQSDILLGAGRMLRHGSEPEDAFWNVAFDLCEQEVLRFFADGLEAAGEFWPALGNDDFPTRQLVFRVLLAFRSHSLKALARSGNVQVIDINMSDCAPFPSEFSGSCRMCGSRIEVGAGSNWSPEFHPNCYQKWKSFMMSIKGILLEDVSKRHVYVDDCGTDASVEDEIEIEDPGYLNVFHE